MSRVVIELSPDPSSLAPEAWHFLASRALEPNPFLEPEFLLPALRHLAPADGSVHTLLAWKETGGGRDLLALLPLAILPPTRRLPLRSFGTWRHPHAFLGTPLIASDEAEPVIRALLDWAARPERPGHLLRFDRLGTDGPFFRLLEGVLRDRGLNALRDELHLRPLYRQGDPFETALAGAMSSEKRRHLGKFRRRLAREGELRVTETSAAADVTAFARQFLHLESAGWKGELGTALGVSPAASAFFSEMLAGFGRRGRLILLSMTVADVPVAMSCSLLAGEWGFGFKAAFDEGQARSSPGLLLAVELLRALTARSEVRWFDSCAHAEGSPFHRLWSDRREIGSLLVPVGGRLGGLFLAALPTLRAVTRRLRRRLPDVARGPDGEPPA